VKHKTTFEASRTIRPIFTRGNVAISKDGHILASCVDEEVLLTDLRNAGDELARIEGVKCLRSGWWQRANVSQDGEIVTSLCSERLLREETLIEVR
jgi:hypothetical protein